VTRIARDTLAGAVENSSGDVSVVIADDDTLRGLNEHHRGLDEDTDVLSFSFSHHGKYYGDDGPPSWRSEAVGFVTPPGEQASLGEVIISYPQAVRQAAELGRSTEQELASLLVHGILHLSGYDHMESDEEAEMKGREAEILARVGYG
jgi:probable rRNA maturation factor